MYNNNNIMVVIKIINYYYSKCWTKVQEKYDKTSIEKLKCD